MIKAMIKDIELFKIAIMAVLGLAGGAVRICSQTKQKSVRATVASLMVSTFVGGITGALLHQLVADPIYLGALCSLSGYAGIFSLHLISDLLVKKGFIKIVVQTGEEK